MIVLHFKFLYMTDNSSFKSNIYNYPPQAVQPDPQTEVVPFHSLGELNYYVSFEGDEKCH